MSEGEEKMAKYANPATAISNEGGISGTEEEEATVKKENDDGGNNLSDDVVVVEKEVESLAIRTPGFRHFPQ